MWSRVLLVAIAISCTFQREIIADPDDVLCVLLLNGLQNEDLDASLLEKLRRHNVNVDNSNNETLIDNCLKKAEMQINKEDTSQLPTTVASKQPIDTLQTLHENANNFTISMLPNEKVGNTKENITEIEYNKEEFGNKSVDFNLINIWKILYKTTLLGFNKNSVTTTKAPTTKTFTKNAITSNENSKIDSQTKYFDYFDKIFQKYITIKEIHLTTMIPTNYENQDIAITNNNLTNLQNMTFENFIHLWKFFDNIKSFRDYSNSNTVNEEARGINDTYNTNTRKNINYQPKEITNRNIVIFNITTPQSENVALQQLKTYLENNNKHNDNVATVSDRKESIKRQSLHYNNDDNDNQLLTRKRALSKFIKKYFRSNDITNASIELESTQQFNNADMKSFPQNNINKSSSSVDTTTKPELQLLPDNVIKEITERIKASVLSDLQNHMKVLTTATSENVKETTHPTFTTSVNNKIDNMKVNNLSILEILQYLNRDSDHENAKDSYTITSTTPINTKKNTQNETTVYKNIMDFFQAYQKEIEHTTDVTSTTTISANEDKNKLSLKAIENVLKLFQELKNEKQHPALTPDMKCTSDQKNYSKNEIHDPVNVLYPSMMPIRYGEAMNPQAVTILPIFINPYPRVFQVNTAKAVPAIPQHFDSNHKFDISGFKLHPVNNFPSLLDVPTILSAPILQTNADMIPPLGIPISNAGKAINQNIVLTTQHPMKRFTHRYQSDTYENKLKDYVGRDIEILNSDTDKERTQESEWLNHKWQSERGRSGHRQNKQHNENTASRLRQPSDFDNFYKEYINNIKPHTSRNHHLFDRNRERFHEKLERVDELQKHDRLLKKEPSQNIRFKVAPRHQVSLDNLKNRARYNDLHLENFIKTQQKVNDILEKILANKSSDGVRSVETPETLNL